MSDKELESVKDEAGDICFERIFDWLLPRFGEDGTIDFWEFHAALMRNYMIHIMRTKDLKPKYYNPKPADVWTRQQYERIMLPAFFAVILPVCFGDFPQSTKHGQHVSH